MSTISANPNDEMERRRSAASGVLRWMEDEITRAPEEHVRTLHENIALAVCRNSLERTAKNGDKLAASVLCSIDGQRLDNLHVASIQDPTSTEGRKNATEHTVRASKFMNLEHKLIDADIVQYTLPADPARTGPQSRHDRVNSARFMLELIHEMRNG